MAASAPKHPYRAVAIGASFGGPDVLQTLLVNLPASFRWPIFIVQHRSPGRDGGFAEMLAKRCALPVVNVEDKLPIRAGHVYIAPTQLSPASRTQQAFGALHGRKRALCTASCRCAT